MSDQEYAELFYGGRPFVRRANGKGKGRRKNPQNRNGEIMTCDNCGADDHFRAQCPQPQHQHQQRAMFTTSAPTPVPSTVQELGPVGDLFLFAADAPASSPDSVPSNTTTIPAEVPVPPRTDLGYYSPSGTTPAVNELPHGYADGQQPPWPQTPTQAVHVENLMQWPTPPPFPTTDLSSLNELPSAGPQDAMTTYPILSQFNQVENIRLDRLRQQSRSGGKYTLGPTATTIKILGWSIIVTTTLG